MHIWVLLFIPLLQAIPRDVITFTGFKVNYNPENHNKDASFHKITQSVVEYMKNLGSRIGSFFGGEETKGTTTSWIEKPGESTTSPPPLTSPTPATLWFGAHWKWPTHRVTTTPSAPISWSPEDHPGQCPTRVDAYVEVADGSLLFQGDRVFSIDKNRSVSSSAVEALFPRVGFVTAGLYNKEKELLILFSERSVWGFLWFEREKKWKMMDDYPKTLPSSIPFTPAGAIRWIDDSQVLLSEDGQLAIYDEVLNESLTTGSAQAYLKGLPEKIKGGSRWTEKGTVRVFTEKTVFDFEKSSQKLEGRPLREFLSCHK